jgi:hypothetical protein
LAESNPCVNKNWNNGGIRIEERQTDGVDDGSVDVKDNDFVSSIVVFGAREFFHQLFHFAMKIQSICPEKFVEIENRRRHEERRRSFH